MNEYNALRQALKPHLVSIQAQVFINNLQNRSGMLCSGYTINVLFPKCFVPVPTSIT